jgi:hypothetical protein
MSFISSRSLDRNKVLLSKVCKVATATLNARIFFVVNRILKAKCPSSFLAKVWSSLCRITIFEAVTDGKYPTNVLLISVRIGLGFVCVVELI